VAGGVEAGGGVEDAAVGDDEIKGRLLGEEGGRAEGEGESREPHGVMLQRMGEG
jgi:hypothetical protein